MHLLINHPAALQKARAELDAVVGTASVVRKSDITNLPYLQSVVKETLLLHPPGHHSWIRFMSVRHTQTIRGLIPY